MQIRKTVESDLEKIGEIYEIAKKFMRETGNPNQWNTPRPNMESAREEMEKGISYVAVEDGEVVAVFMFTQEKDPTYAQIFEGNWLSDAPYGVIHRLAVAKHGQGIVGHCLDYCWEICHNIRIDTHRDNLPMQRALLKRGFEYCGIIYLENGAERLAYQRLQS